MLRQLLARRHADELRPGHHKLLLQTVGFQRRERTYPLISYERYYAREFFLLAAAVQRVKERLICRVIIETMDYVENPAPGRQETIGVIVYQNTSGLSKQQTGRRKPPLPYSK